MGPNILVNGPGNQMRNLRAFPQAMADVGGGDGKGRAFEDMKTRRSEAPGADRWGRKAKRMIRALHDQKLAESDQFTKISPAPDALKVIRSQKKKEPVPLFPLPEAAERVNGIGDSAPFDFEVERAKPRLVGDSGAHHGHAVTGAGQFAVCFVGGSRAGDEKNTINGKAFKRVASDLKVPPVNGIECAAKDRDVQRFEQASKFGRDPITLFSERQFPS